MEIPVLEKEVVYNAEYNDYLTHEPDDDDFVDIEEGFKMIHENVDRIYRENGEIRVGYLKIRDAYCAISEGYCRIRTGY